MVQVGGLLVFAACVLQNAFVTAAPDFGVAVSIGGSVAVQGAIVRFEQRLVEISTHMDFSLSSSYEKLRLLQDQFTFLVRNLTSIGTAFAMALNSATTSNSNVGGTFESVILTLSHLQTLQVAQIDGIVAAVDNIVGQPLRAQLDDSTNTIYSSVQNLYGALIQLVAAIQTSNDPANIDVAFVNHLTRAVDVLRANMLPLNYTIGSTGENIRVADAFLTRLLVGFQFGELAIVNEVQRFQSQVGLLTNETLRVANCAMQQMSGIEMMAEPFLQTLCGVCRAACPLQTAVESVVELTTTEFVRVTRVVKRHLDDLASNSVFVQEAVDNFSDIYELGLLLADVTIIMRPYSMYCFNKFAQLVEQLVPRLTDGFVVCFREELTRLRSLRTSLVSMFHTFVYDVEDLVEHLRLCTMVRERSECVAEVALLYKRLAKQLEEKMDVIEKYSLAETSASYDRLQLCAFQTSVTVFYTNIEQLTSDIETCRQNGPHVLI